MRIVLAGFWKVRTGEIHKSKVLQSVFTHISKCTQDVDAFSLHAERILATVMAVYWAPPNLLHGGERKGGERGPISLSRAWGRKSSYGSHLASKATPLFEESSELVWKSIENHGTGFDPFNELHELFLLTIPSFATRTPLGLTSARRWSSFWMLKAWIMRILDRSDERKCAFVVASSSPRGH